MPDKVLVTTGGGGADTTEKREFAALARQLADGSAVEIDETTTKDVCAGVGRQVHNLFAKIEKHFSRRPRPVGARRKHKKWEDEFEIMRDRISRLVAFIDMMHLTFPFCPEREWLNKREMICNKLAEMDKKKDDPKWKFLNGGGKAPTRDSLLRKAQSVGLLPHERAALLERINETTT